MVLAKNLKSIYGRPHDPVIQTKDATDDINSSSDLSEELKFDLIGAQKSDQLSLFSPKHRHLAALLIDHFQKIKSADDLEKAAFKGRDEINPLLFYYAFTVALMNRKDTDDVLVYSFAEVFPERFCPAGVFQEAREQLNVMPQGSRPNIAVDITQTSTDINPEQKLSYFREDLGINLMYYNWYVLHPSEAIDKTIVDIDRRGELYCYLHQQIIAHYNAERVSNSMLDVVALNNFDKPIPEGYFSKLNTYAESHSWAARAKNSILCDLDRPEEWLTLDINEFQRWIDRVCNAIELNQVVKDDADQTLITLNNDQGIDVLGNMLQASSISPNRYYGDICNYGMSLLAYVHDPENQFNQSYSVMGEPATCMRDPVFYRWFANIVRIIQFHKAQLPPYTTDQLGNDGIQMKSLDVEYVNQDEGNGNTNEFTTFWTQTDFNIGNGLSLQPVGDVYVRFQHLDHYAFRYLITIENTSNAAKTGTVRIFMCPKYGPRNRVLTFDEMRTGMFELDRFQQTLDPGLNKIVRKSTESAVTMPKENIFHPDKVRQDIQKNTKDASSFCLCGWPEYMLIPKGSKKGTTFILFAMFSNGDGDKVDGISSNADDTNVYNRCTSGTSYCSLKDGKYPDKRPMGFPFDRPAPRAKVVFIDDFIQPNMKIQEVVIKFHDSVQQSDLAKGVKEITPDSDNE